MPLLRAIGKVFRIGKAVAQVVTAKDDPTIEVVGKLIAKAQARVSDDATDHDVALEVQKQAAASNMAVVEAKPARQSAILQAQWIGPAATFIAAIAARYGLDWSADDIAALIGGAFALHALITAILRKKSRTIVK